MLNRDGTCQPHVFCSLGQGYVEVLSGVPHGALQFMAYEELKKATAITLVHQSVKNW